MPNSFRKRLKKALLESDLSSEEVKRVLDAVDKQLALDMGIQKDTSEEK